MVNARKWLDWNYPIETRKRRTSLDIKDKNVEGNLNLTDFGFLADLENLEELKVDDNAGLIEILRSYGDDWKIYRENKDIQEIFGLIRQNSFQGLARKSLDLSKRHEYLKNHTSTLLPRDSNETKEIVLSLEEAFKNKEVELSDLRKKVIESKEGELEQAKSDFVKKRLEKFARSNGKEEIEESLDAYLISIEDLMLDHNNRSALKLKEKEEKYLLKGKSELTELLNKLSEKQQEIISLKTQQKIIVEEIQVISVRRRESASEKALVYQAKKDKIQFGIPTPLGFAGMSGERDRSRLEISEQYSQTQQAAELGQKIIDQQFQAVEEQNQRSQIEQTPK